MIRDVTIRKMFRSMEKLFYVSNVWSFFEHVKSKSRARLSIVIRNKIPSWRYAIVDTT